MSKKRSVAKTQSKAKKLRTIALFAGALGLDLGLENTGFITSIAVECNQYAVESLKANRPSLNVLAHRIEDLTTAKILGECGMAVGEAEVVTGGPSCRPFSNAGSRKSMDSTEGNLFEQFIRVVDESQPRFFVMENVRGLLSAAIRHRPLNERGPGFPELESDEELGSALLKILKAFQELNYYTVFDLVNAADYGVPQARERLIFIGSRDGESVTIPQPTHNMNGENGLPKWNTLRHALTREADIEHTYLAFSARTIEYLKKINAGQNWRNLPKSEQKIAIGKAFDSWGGRSGFLRRLAWDKPSPTLTTDPNGRATMLCHPDEDRPLSVEDYARIQQFPDEWQFAGSVSQQYIQAGNAVPIGLGEAIGRALRSVDPKSADHTRKGLVVCPNERLLKRLSKRPRTQMNPPRMRKDQSLENAKAWMKKVGKHRSEVLAFAEQQAMDFTIPPVVQTISPLSEDAACPCSHVVDIHNPSLLVAGALK